MQTPYKYRESGNWPLGSFWLFLSSSVEKRVKELGFSIYCRRSVDRSMAEAKHFKYVILGGGVAAVSSDRSDSPLSSYI